MGHEDRVLVDVVVGAPPDVVWTALRDPDVVSRWFGWDDDGLDAEIEQIFLVEPTADADARTVVWPDGDRIAVTTAEDGATQVVVTRHAHGDDEGLVGAYDAVDEGWITFVHQLRFALERHPDQGRRTISVRGLALGPEDDALLARLGLRPLGDEPAGAAYTIERSDGSSFSGEVAFQTDLQIGLTVAEEDDALLVVARTPPAAAPPHGAVMFVLSLYGMDDARVAEAEQRWNGWWGGPEQPEDAAR